MCWPGCASGTAYGITGWASGTEIAGSPAPPWHVHAHVMVGDPASSEQIRMRFSSAPVPRSG